jgi:hypothetical protein
MLRPSAPVPVSDPFFSSAAGTGKPTQFPRPLPYPSDSKGYETSSRSCHGPHTRQPPLSRSGSEGTRSRGGSSSSPPAAAVHLHGHRASPLHLACAAVGGELLSVVVRRRSALVRPRLRPPHRGGQQGSRFGGPAPQLVVLPGAPRRGWKPIVDIDLHPRLPSLWMEARRRRLPSTSSTADAPPSSESSSTGRFGRHRSSSHRQGSGVGGGGARRRRLAFSCLHTLSPLICTAAALLRTPPPRPFS